jgi:hypothetical protein
MQSKYSETYLPVNLDLILSIKMNDEIKRKNIYLNYFQIQVLQYSQRDSIPKGWSPFFRGEATNFSTSLDNHFRIS